MNTKTNLLLFLITLFFTPTFAQYQVGQDIEGEGAGDRSGYSVSLSSDGMRVAIGAPWNDMNTDDDRGHVRIYDWIGGAWQQVGEDINGEGVSDRFGHSVSLSSDGMRVAIGAIRNDGFGYNAGHARIYDLVGGAWQQVGGDIDGEDYSDESGYSISLSSDGSRVAIGSIENSENGTDAGHVRIYDLVGGQWQQVGEDINGTSSGQSLGYSISMSLDGSRVAIGAPGSWGGRVRIYDFMGGIWQQIGNDINVLEGDFGVSVSLSADGSRVAVGDPFNDLNDDNEKGYVAVYDLIGGQWQQVGENIKAEESGSIDGTYISLSSDGNRLAIGAESNSENGSFAGHVRIYGYIGGIWRQVGTDINGESTNDHLGFSVSISSDGGRVAIGAYGNDNNGQASGHVRVYENFFTIDLFNNNAACVGLSNGSINIVSNGVTSPYSFSYELIDENGIVVNSDIFEMDNFTIDNLLPGNFTFNIINDQSSTIHQEIITVEGLTGSIFEITEISTVNSVNSFPNGNIIISVDGGSPDYTYSWFGPSSGSATSGTTDLEIEFIPPGLYSITIIDGNGNVLEKDIQVLDETNPEPSCNQPLDIVILNDCSGSVDAVEYSESKQFFVDFCAALNVGTNSEDSQVAIVEWSSSDQQIVKIPLTGIQANLQNYINSTRAFEGDTNPNTALSYGHDYLETEGRAGVTKVLVLSTDAYPGQVSNSLVALSESYQAEGYVIATIAFDGAFTNAYTQSILQQTATLEILAPGAPAYSQLTESLAENIVNLYICPLDPGASNTVYFNRDGLLEFNDYIVNGDCVNIESIDLEFTVTALQQLAIPAGTPITFYYNNPASFGGTQIVTTYIPCAIEAGASETLTVTLPVTGPSEIWGVLNDNGSQSPPINLPVTNIDELVYINNIDQIAICVDPLPTVSVLKYTTTPIPICGNTVIYTIDVCNISSVDLVDVEVIDDVPTGFVLLNESINDNDCALGTNLFDLPVGCCVSITSEYDVTNAANGFYNDEDTELSGPSGQVYIDFEGESTTAEDVLIGDDINCDSDDVFFQITVNVTESCDDRFITCLFEITNSTNVALQSLDFSADIPVPSIWAGEPYFLDGLSLGTTNITGNTTANFIIAEVAPLSTASFMIDVFLGDWEDSGSFDVEAILSQLPSFVNGNGVDISITSSTVAINAGPTFITAPEVQILPGDNANFTLELINGQNPIWDTEGDGVFNDTTSLNPIYTPGAVDIANGSVLITIVAENSVENCSPDSTQILLLIQCNQFYTNEILNFCEGDTVTVFGIIATEDTVLEEMYTAANGCDSIAQVTVLFDESVFTSELLTLCEGDTVIVFGMPITEDAIFEESYISVFGCDSIAQTTVQFIDNIYTNETLNFCEGDTAIIFGMLIIEDAVLEENYTSINGCDSIAQVTVQFNEQFYFTETQFYCEGDTAIVFGTQITEDTILEEMYVAVNGCDSIVQVTIEFNESFYTSEIFTFCEGDTATVFGIQFSEDTILEETFTAANGCDSIAQVNVLFNESFFINETLNFCKGDTATVFGMQLTEDADLEETYSTVQGCDSTIRITVQFYESIFTSETLTFCEGDTAIVFGMTITEDAVLEEFYTSIGGCDSTVQVTVLFYENFLVSETLTFCEGDTAIVFGVPITEDTVWEENYATINGCDSIFEVSVFFIEDVEILWNENICEGEQFTFFNDTISQPGIYTYTIESNADYCDTSYVLMLDFYPPIMVTLPATMSAFSEEAFELPLESNDENLEYLWSPAEYLSCVNCTNPIAILTEDQFFMVTITDVNGCENQAEIEVIVEERWLIYIPNVFSPNGDNLNDHFAVFSNLENVEVVSMRVYSRWGELLHESTNFSSNDPTNGWDGMFRGKKMPDGVYVYQILLKREDGTTILKSGDFTLLK